MKQPAGELDARFSDEEATATGWEETRRLLETAELFWISTVRADGRPHVTPLVAVWLGDTIYFATGPEEQKAVDLRGNRYVMQPVAAGARRRRRGRGRPVTDPGILEGLAEAWATKWDGRWHYEVHDGGFRHEGGSGAVLVFSVEPAKVLAFAKGTFGQTRYSR